MRRALRLCTSRSEPSPRQRPLTWTGTQRRTHSCKQTHVRQLGVGKRTRLPSPHLFGLGYKCLAPVQSILGDTPQAEAAQLDSGKSGSSLGSVRRRTRPIVGFPGYASYATSEKPRCLGVQSLHSAGTTSELSGSQSVKSC